MALFQPIDSGGEVQHAGDRDETPVVAIRYTTVIMLDSTKALDDCHSRSSSVVVDSMPSVPNKHANVEFPEGTGNGAPPQLKSGSYGEIPTCCMAWRW